MQGFTGRLSGFGVGAALIAALAASAAAKGPTIKDQRLAACYDDMVRLCSGEPDKGKLKTCIRPRRAQVSAACRAWLDKPE